MTATVIVLLIVLTGELMLRQGFAPLKTLGRAAAGTLTLR